MGRPKQLLEWEGEAWIEKIARELSLVTDEILLAGEGELPSALAGIERVADPPGSRGPAAGLLAALRARPGATILAVACDQPLVERSALAWLWTEWSERRGSMFTDVADVADVADLADLATPDALMPRLLVERLEPFPGIYAASCVDALETLAAAAGRSAALQRLPELVRVESPLVPEEFRSSWRGFNRPEDLRGLLEPAKPSRRLAAAGEEPR